MKHSEAMVYLFGPFRVDPTDRRLTRDGEVVALPPKALDTLVALLEGEGRLVDKGALMKRVWADAFVEEVNLARNVSLLRKILGERAPGLQYIETVPTRGYRFGGRVQREYALAPAADPGIAHRNRPRAVTAIAVLPFENLSGDPEQEYFVDGITDAVIGAVAAVGSLRVISRTSVMHLKGSRASLQQVAQTLRVDACIEGSVVRSGDTVRVSVGLIDVSDDRHLWTATYDRKLEDILVMQSEIAHAIAGALRLALIPGVEGGRGARVNPLAYDLYLKGRFQCATFTQKGFERGLGSFERALSIDPTCALAYFGQSHAWLLLALERYPPHDAFPRVRSAAEKALALNGELSEAHVELGFVSGFYEWNWACAEDHGCRALRLNPNSSFARVLRCYAAITRGEMATALEHIAQARDHDPLSPFVNSLASLVLYALRRTADGQRVLSDLMGIAPRYPPAHIARAYLLEQEGRIGDAIAAMQQATELFGTSPLQHGRLGRLYARAGHGDRARSMLQELDAMSREQATTDPTAAAMIHVGLGEATEAFERLDEAWQFKSTQLVWLKASPIWEPLRSDKRFYQLLQRLGTSAGVRQ